MPNYCEDAPCCGCCGTNIYGQYQGDTGPSDFDYDQPDFEPWDGEDDEDEDQGGWEGNEDAAMESGLFGDC